jgi:hypothetical protein
MPELAGKVTSAIRSCLSRLATQAVISKIRVTSYLTSRDSPNAGAVAPNAE